MNIKERPNQQKVDSDAFCILIQEAGERKNIEEISMDEKILRADPFSS